jgi:predicted lipid-binding transport protein (Tim44 family)
MTGILRFALVLQVIGYIFYVIVSLFGGIDYPSGYAFIVFIAVTFGFLLNVAIIGSIIELRERFLDGSSSPTYTKRSKTYSSSKSGSYVPPTFPNANRASSSNIVQTGSAFIQEAETNHGWTCDCGIKNQSGLSTCIGCGKQSR